MSAFLTLAVFGTRQHAILLLLVTTFGVKFSDTPLLITELVVCDSCVANSVTQDELSRSF